MKKFIPYVCLLFVFAISSCEHEAIMLETFPTSVGSVEALNTEYNDINEAIGGFLYDDISFIISTDRESQGGNFNIENKYLSFTEISSGLIFNEKDGYPYYDSALNVINSTFNEKSAFITSNSLHTSDVFVFGTDKIENSDFYYTIGDFTLSTWSDPVSFDRINTTSNEQDFIAYSNGVMYCSDATGNFDIYKISVDVSQTFKEWIQDDDELTPESFDILNSDSNDINPFINGNYIFFASDREGGYGGYDLYYSHYDNGEWSTPVNMGSEINTENDEIKPLAVYYMGYENDIMFFSSNRTGGKGGYDIYYVGISSVID